MRPSACTSTRTCRFERATSSSSASPGIDSGSRSPRRRRRQLVDDALEAAGASHLATERVGRLSGGEQQRVLIAHAVVGQPDLLVLDEPLANLDLASVGATVEPLHHLAVDRGIAVFLSATR